MKYLLLFFCAILLVFFAALVTENLNIPDFYNFIQKSLTPRVFLSQVSPGPNEAVFYLSPASGNFNVGNNFSVALRVGSSEVITSVKTYLDFSYFRISVVSISTTNSTFANWWENSFNNSTGKIQLQASTPSPGFTGDGLVATINFQAIAAGTTNIAYSSSSLALKPTDENILNLSRSTGATFTITASSSADTAPPYTTGHNPAKGATGVASSTNIILQVLDSGNGVNISSIVMTVEGVTTTPVITGSSSNYTLTYNPPTNFSYSQVVDVTVDARDLATPSNVMTRDSYSFTIASAPTPPPPPSCTDCGLSTPVITPAGPQQGSSFTITCPANNTGYDCINAYVNTAVCTFSNWSGNNAFFNCSSVSAGNYTAKCQSATGTSRNCCASEKTTTFTVAAAPSSPGGGTPSSPGGSTPPPDTFPPAISEVKVSDITFSSVSITWKTNEPATSQIEYGTTLNYEAFTPPDNSLTTDHSVKITGLSQKISYYFRVISKDGSGNQIISSGTTFITISRPKLLGDFNGDDKINIYDLSILLSNWKTTKAEYDLNEDGAVSIFDLSIILSNWTK